MKKPQGSITMSVFTLAKNAASCIERMLASAFPWATEFVMVDDASTDDTAEIASHWCRTHGLTFVHVRISPETHPGLYRVDEPATYEHLGDGSCPGPFTGRPLLVDFAGARNEGWSRVTSSWALVLDADDTVQNREAIPVDVGGAISCGATRIQGRYDVAGRTGGARGLIFRMDAAGRWQGRIHEHLPHPPSTRVGTLRVLDHRDNAGTDVRIPNHYLKVAWLSCQEAGWWGANPHDLGCLVLDLNGERHESASGALAMFRQVCPADVELRTYVEAELRRRQEPEIERSSEGQRRHGDEPGNQSQEQP